MSRKLRGTKAHTRYYTRDGTLVPGTTTITGILAKPALITWANNMGLQGINTNKYVSEAAAIGTLAHYLVQCHLQGSEPDTSLYSAEQLDKAENALLSFYEWLNTRELEPILLEEPLVSERYRFGGTVDCYCLLDDIPTLLDFKTGSGIYPEMHYQVAAYKQLLTEHGHQVENVRILRIGRDETEGFEDRQIRDCERSWQIFKHCLEIYRLRKRAS